MPRWRKPCLRRPRTDDAARPKGPYRCSAYASMYDGRTRKADCPPPNQPARRGGSQMKRMPCPCKRNTTTHDRPWPTTNSPNRPLPDPLWAHRNDFGWRGCRASRIVPDPTQSIPAYHTSHYITTYTYVIYNSRQLRRVTGRIGCLSHSLRRAAGLRGKGTRALQEMARRR